MTKWRISALLHLVNTDAQLTNTIWCSTWRLQLFWKTLSEQFGHWPELLRCKKSVSTPSCCRQLTDADNGGHLVSLQSTTHNPSQKSEFSATTQRDTLKKRSGGCLRWQTLQTFAFLIAMRFKQVCVLQSSQGCGSHCDTILSKSQRARMFCHGCADMSSWSATQRDCCLMQFLETHMHPLSTVIWCFGECSCQICQMKTCFCCPMISTDIALLTCMVAGCSCSPKNGFMVRKSFTFCAIVSRANLLCCKIQAQNSVWNCCLAKADGTIWPTWRHFQFQKALSSTMSTIATQTFAFICPLNEHWFGQLGVWNQVLFCDQWLNKATIHVWGNWCCDSFALCMFVFELMNNHPGWLQKKTDNSRHIRSSVFVDTQGTPIAKRILLTPNQMTNLSSVDNWQQLLPAQGWRTSVSWLCSDASKSGSIFQFLCMAKCLISVWDGVLQCEMGFCFCSRIFSASMWGRELGLLLLGRQLSDCDERSRTVRPASTFTS